MHSHSCCCPLRCLFLLSSLQSGSFLLSSQLLQSLVLSYSPALPVSAGEQGSPEHRAAAASAVPHLQLSCGPRMQDVSLSDPFTCLWHGLMPAQNHTVLAVLGAGTVLLAHLFWAGDQSCSWLCPRLDLRSWLHFLTWEVWSNY